MGSSDPQGSSPKLFAGVLVTRAQGQPCLPCKLLWFGRRLPDSLSHFFPCRGHSPEWYSKGFGHLCAAELARIRNSFQPLIAEGPETKIWVLPSVTSNSGNRKLTWTFVAKSVSVRKRAGERRWWTWLILKNGNTAVLECRRCKNFLGTFSAFLEMATSLLI